MAQFHVNQRVRIIGTAGNATYAHMVGAEAVIVRHWEYAATGHHWVIDVPGFAYEGNPFFGMGPTEYAVFNECLSPLTDPKADEWAREQVRIFIQKCNPKVPVPA
jgi:hypothetical protein